MRRHLWLPAAALSVGMLVAGCGSTGEAAGTDGGNSSAVSGEASGESSGESASAAQVAVAEQGFSQVPAGESSPPSVSYAVVLENTGTTTANARVQLIFRGADGGTVSVQDESLRAVPPGSRVAVANTLYDVDGVVDLDAQVLPPGSGGAWEDAVALTAEQVTTVRQEQGGLTTTGTIRSSFARELQDVHVAAVYRGADGQVIGGDYTVVPLVAANGTAQVEVTSFGDGPTPASTELYAQPSAQTLLDETPAPARS